MYFQVKKLHFDTLNIIQLAYRRTNSVEIYTINNSKDTKQYKVYYQKKNVENFNIKNRMSKYLNKWCNYSGLKFILKI